MAQALTQHQELSNQLRFLLFEIGIELTPASVEYFITLAHRDCINRLQDANRRESIVTSPLYSHHIDDCCQQLQKAWFKISPASRFYPWPCLHKELSESIANQSLALAYRHLWNDSLARQCRSHPHLWHWITHDLTQHQQLEFLEQWGSNDHHSPPNFKAKIGLSRREVMQYSPEFQARVNIHWCALHRNRQTTSQMSEDYFSLIQRSFPIEMALWKEQLKQRKLSFQDYVPIPVHPWQYRNKIQDYFAHLIDTGCLVPPLCHQSSKPSMPFATMMTNQGLALKLAAAVCAPDAMCIVSPAAVHNGPALSHCLESILKENQYFDDSCRIAFDLAGIHVGKKNSINHDSKHLAAIARQNPIEYLTPGETLAPLASLLTLSPITQTPLLIEIVKQSNESPLDYFKHYLRMVLQSRLPLYLKYGIALEAHQQSTLIVFNRNKPSRLINRNLDDIRINLERLTHTGHAVTLFEASNINCGSLDEIRHKFIHANLQSNIAHWVRCFSQYFSLDKKKLWHEVEQELIHQLDLLKHQVPACLLQQQRDALLTQNWPHKCLLRMRLEHSQDSILKPSINPLIRSKTTTQ